MSIMSGSRSSSKCLLQAAGVLYFLVGLSLGMNVDSRGNKHVPGRERRATQSEAEAFLTQYTSDAEDVYSSYVFASWEYNTNITDYNAAKEVEESLNSAAFSYQSAQDARQFDDDVDSFDEDVQRQLQFISDIGVAALDSETVAEYNTIMSEMQRIYSTAQVCRPEDPSECLYLSPGLEEVMATSTDYEELTWAWEGFRDEAGVPNKPLYERYVEIANEGARANGYEDQGDAWRSDYGDDTEEVVYELYDAILPLYKQLHAYVRRRLNAVHGSENIPLDGYMPANVLGDMWGRFWGNIYPLVVPYPDKPNIDVTDEMVRQGYTVQQMFEMGDDFFTSMGLIEVNQGFWDNSMVERPDDGRDVVCHPSAWDFYNRQDFRIKQCTQINMDYFLTVHHELGHIQYFMQYKDLPVPFRDGANGAFHEAIGEVISQSVATPKHLDIVGLFNDTDVGDEVSETDINFLLKMSLTTIGTLPFSLALEQWRWDVFRGDAFVVNGTERWWQLKHDLVGVRPPVDRNEEDFEPGAMYHIIISYPFIGYYIRTIIQFQFYESLCKAAGHTGPLHKCDFYNSVEAGQLLGDMLKLGKSQPWPDAMEAITGQREMSADAILQYFQPLMEWLEEENAANGEVIGWPAYNPPTQEPTVQPTTARSAPRLVSSLGVLYMLIVLLLAYLI